MAAPAATVRSDPTGRMLEDGYRSLITFAADTNIELWEKSVTPPGIDGGDAVDITTMHNDTVRTKAPRSLKDYTDATAVCAYDPSAYTALQALINVRTTVTVTFPDGSTLAFFGFLRSAEFGDLVEGEHPEVTVTITPTNWDYTNDVEAAPVLTSVSGT
jgi:hypothetical protein